VRRIGAASLLADLGHEVPTALFPSFLTGTLGAPAAALGLIEGVADGLSGAAKLAGGALADDPARRRVVAAGGYAGTAVLTALIGLAAAAWQAGALRTAAWVVRGLRVPSRNALLAEAVPIAAFGRAYGFERAMDNLGAIGGPLLALGLVAALGVRGAILVSVVPGLLAAVAIIGAIRRLPGTGGGLRRSVRLRLRPALSGRTGRLMVGIAVFEAGNVAATLLILRATEALEPARGYDGAVRAGLVLYLVHNLAATVVSIPAGRLGDRLGMPRVLAGGAALVGLAYLAVGAGDGLAPLAIGFLLAGAGIGCVETAEHAAIAAAAPADVRGSAFGVLAGVQSVGNLVASAGAGALWTLVSARAAFLALAAWALAAVAAMAWAASGR
jgi:MFS family permease